MVGRGAGRSAEPGLQTAWASTWKSPRTGAGTSEPSKAAQCTCHAKCSHSPTRQQRAAGSPFPETSICSGSKTKKYQNLTKPTQGVHAGNCRVLTRGARGPPTRSPQTEHAPEETAVSLFHTQQFPDFETDMERQRKRNNQNNRKEHGVSWGPSPPDMETCGPAVSVAGGGGVGGVGEEDGRRTDRAEREKLANWLRPNLKLCEKVKRMKRQAKSWRKHLQIMYLTRGFIQSVHRTPNEKWAKDKTATWPKAGAACSPAEVAVPCNTLQAGWESRALQCGASEKRGPGQARPSARTGGRVHAAGTPGPCHAPLCSFRGRAASSRGTVLLRLLKRAGARKVGATPPHTPASKDEETASTWPSRLSRDQSRRRPCAPTPSPPLPQASLQDTCSCPQTPCPRPPGVAGVVWLPRQTSLLSQGQLGWALSSSRVEPEQE